MKEKFLQKAEENLPLIKYCDIKPNIGLQKLKKGDSIVIDLGNHYVGYFSFDMGWVDMYIDAPVRFKMNFCEIERELKYDFSIRQENLSASWIQEEIINVDFPGTYKMERRYAARYIRITVLEATKELTLSNFVFKAQTSADMNSLIHKEIADEDLRKIDTVAINTLKNCMHRIFEDGPKRDRRLWIGDLRLQALANYYTFNNIELVKRCLYLFAAADTSKQGILPGYIYENPCFVSGYWYLQDYALLYGVCVCDYYLHTKDKDTFLELYPIVKSQFEAVFAELDSDGIVAVPNKGDVFVDWSDSLSKITAMQGIYLYALDIVYNVLKEINHEDCGLFKKMYDNGLEAAKKVLYDENNNSFANERDGFQESVHSVIWMILAGVIKGEKAKELLTSVLKSKETIKLCTPYANHYLVEALLKLDMKKEAFDHIKYYWKSMIDLGTDTFFEMHVPGMPDFAPDCGHYLFNSMCHAWSCTPTYFIRKYME